MEGIVLVLMVRGHVGEVPCFFCGEVRRALFVLLDADQRVLVCVEVFPVSFSCLVVEVTLSMCFEVGVVSSVSGSDGILLLAFIDAGIVMLALLLSCETVGVELLQFSHSEPPGSTRLLWPTACKALGMELLVYETGLPSQRYRTDASRCL